jgi:tRNA dimethylallyltransferase
VKRAALRWLVVAGPTAAGKSGVAIELAERFGGEIVNADSRQVFREMDIGTAKPTAAERARVPHHVYDVVRPDEPFDAAIYRSLARPAVEEIAARERLPIVVGGTGLYLRTLARGLFVGPSAAPRLRSCLENLERERPGSLARWCRRLDADVAARIHPNDTVRLVRAIEVALVTGEPLSRHQRRHGFGERLGEPLWLVLDPGSEELDRRIGERSRAMFAGGLLEELRALWQRYDPELRPLRSIGYREAGEVLRGRATVAEATEELVRSTRRFARRQRIWFRGEAAAEWMDPARTEEIGRRVEAFLARA